MLSTPEIVSLPPKILIGHSRKMSLAHDMTFDLFRGFMPLRGTISGRVNESIYDLRVYDPGVNFADFRPITIFTKWAAVEVVEGTVAPDGLNTYALPGGRYAKFIHQGPASEAPGIFQHIFGVWLPSSGFELDDRPHFEILPAGYRRDDPAAQEEIWLPVRATNDPTHQFVTSNRLTNYSMTHLFVYGTLLSNIPSSMSKFLRRRAVLIGKATTAGSLYDLGMYPGFVAGGAGVVKGELYRINPENETQTWEMLDAYESVTGEPEDQYRRLEITVQVGGGGSFKTQTYEYKGNIDGLTEIPKGDYPAFYQGNQAHGKFVNGE